MVNFVKIYLVYNAYSVSNAISSVFNCACTVFSGMYGIFSTPDKAYSVIGVYSSDAGCYNK